MSDQTIAGNGNANAKNDSNQNSGSSNGLGVLDMSSIDISSLLKSLESMAPSGLGSILQNLGSSSILSQPQVGGAAPPLATTSNNNTHQTSTIQSGACAAAAKVGGARSSSSQLLAASTLGNADKHRMADSKIVNPAKDDCQVVVLPMNSLELFSLEIGGRNFQISRHLLNRIPGLAQAIAQASEAASDAAASTERDVKSAPYKATQNYFVEGDHKIYESIFSYARGNRAFLGSLRRRMLRSLRLEAQKLGMDELVEDIDWHTSPTPDPGVLQSLDNTVTRVCAYLRMPMIHQILIQNQYYQSLFGYVQQRANNNARSLEDEIRHIVREVAQCREFEGLVCGERMPSLQRAQDQADSISDSSPPKKSSVMDVYWEHARGLAAHIAPRFVGQLVQEFFQQLNQQMQNHHHENAANDADGNAEHHPQEQPPANPNVNPIPQAQQNQNPNANVDAAPEAKNNQPSSPRPKNMPSDTD